MLSPLNLFAESRAPLYAALLLLLLASGVASAATKKHKSAKAATHSSHAKVTRAPSSSHATKKSAAAHAKARTPSRAPASRPPASHADYSREPAMSDGGTSEKVLKVQGQTRNLSMMLTLKSEKDKIKFGEVRENFKDLIPKTNY